MSKKGNWVQQLGRELIKEKFDLDSALELSNRMHDHAQAGLRVSPPAIRLWGILTAKIEAASAPAPTGNQDAE